MSLCKSSGFVLSGSFMGKSKLSVGSQEHLCLHHTSPQSRSPNLVTDGPPLSQSRICDHRAKCRPIRASLNFLKWNVACKGSLLPCCWCSLPFPSPFLGVTLPHPEFYFIFLKSVLKSQISFGLILKKKKKLHLHI